MNAQVLTHLNAYRTGWSQPTAAWQHLLPGPERTHAAAVGRVGVTRARLQVIRQVLKECEEAKGHTPIADACFDDDGTVDFQHILCSACTEPEADDSNDILLCDGEFCNRAYHVACLPVKDCFRVEDLPEEEGWLCPACDCRADIMWELTQAFDLDFDTLILSRCGARLPRCRALRLRLRVRLRSAAVDPAHALLAGPCTCACVGVQRALLSLCWAASVPPVRLHTHMPDTLAADQ